MAFERFKELGPERYQEIVSDLLAGVSPAEVARRVAPYLPAMRPNSLLRQIVRLRREVTREHLAEAGRAQADRTNEPPPEARTEGFDPVAKLRALCRLQEQRLYRLMRLETRAGSSRAIHEAQRDWVANLLRLDKLESARGVSERHPPLEFDRALQEAEEIMSRHKRESC